MVRLGATTTTQSFFFNESPITENCPPATNTSGYTIVDNIRSVAQNFGSIKLFKAYLDVSEHVPLSRPLLLFSELQSSGVSLTDCPRNGRKDVADKMIIGKYVLNIKSFTFLNTEFFFSVDMLAHAIDNSAPSTIVLISGDRDFAYALSILRLRRYRIVLITLSNAHPSLRAQASLCFNWTSDVLGTVDPTSVLHQPISPRRGKTSIPPTHNRILSNTNLSRSPQEPYDEKPASSNVEYINHLQDKAKYRDINLTPPKCDFRPASLPPELESSKKQPADSMASTNLRNGPESLARIIYSPVASSSHAHLNDSIETTLIMTGTSHNSSSSQTLPCPPSAKLAPHGNFMASRFHTTHTSPLGSTSSPNLVLEQEVTNATEPVSFESAMQTEILPAELDLQRLFPSLQQQSAYSTKILQLIDC